MESHIGNIMTLSNSIIGVSILAMPFCFKQCGVILAILMLLTSSVITRLTCHFLLKSAIMSRRRTFELLAFHTFGTAGKFMVELGIIGFLMGTCIAFFVIIGDLGPAIIAKMMGTKPTDLLRTYILIGVALFCVVPLGLLKNVDSLHSVSTATIGFYFCLVLKTIAESMAHLISGDWLLNVELWRPAGVLQCLPIFAMALSCQTQLFEIYDTVSNPTLDKMNYIVRAAINICVGVYIFVGFFGYSAFAKQTFTGNILMSFSPSLATDIMKIGFVLSVAFSFPLVIFPCRASLYSLLFKKGYTPYEGTNNYIPESKFKFLTAIIIGASLIIGILIPNIEVVLGLLGSTIGTMICLIFPVTCFICISTKNTNERLIAQILLFVGVIVMVLGTYANLYAMEQINEPVAVEKLPVVEINNDIMKKIESQKILQAVPPEIKQRIENPVLVKNKIEEIRLEPPQPVEPQDETKKIGNFVKEVIPKIEKVNIANIVKNKNKELKPGEMQKVEETITEPIKEIVRPAKKVELVTKKAEEVDVEAIKKEETELQEEEKNKVKEDNEEKQKTELLKKLEENKKEQESLIKEQKELIQELKKEKQELKEKQKNENKVEEEVRRKAASQILEIAKKAIEQLAPESVTKSSSLDQAKNNQIPVQEKKNVTNVSKSTVVDPIAKKIIDFANNNAQNNNVQNINKPAQNEIPLPLPVAVNRSISVTKLLTQREIQNTENKTQEFITKQQNENPQQILNQVENHISLENEEKNKKMEEQKQINEKKEENESIIIQKENKISELEGIKPKENIPNENILPQRDILANEENTENMRNKREIKKIKTDIQNNENCEKTEQYPENTKINVEKGNSAEIIHPEKSEKYLEKTNILENLHGNRKEPGTENVQKENTKINVQQEISAEIMHTEKSEKYLEKTKNEENVHLNHEEPETENKQKEAQIKDIGENKMNLIKSDLPIASKLVTEMSKSDILKIESNNLIQSMKSQLNIESIHIKRK